MGDAEGSGKETSEKEKQNRVELRVARESSDRSNDKGVTALYFREREINIHEEAVLRRVEKVEI